ncbi:MAG TPA: peptidoglycan-binding domain-containing protein [Acetobacteraceae bacterium]|jgi:peptidoglycan hydrolase-like protein with peptidoglycan-binding domain|nr:peptidoglycan-binding domain-containing protein [Acetobacteraceae bacterium]
MRSLALLAAFALIAQPAAAQTAQTAPPALNYVQPLTPAGIQAVQQRLQQAGAYSGQVDGVWGADSQAALTQFQQLHQLQVTGQMNQATAAVLGLNITQLLGGGSAPTPVAQQPRPLSPRAVRALQSRLQQLGYYTGSIDGEWGPRAESALQRFQQASGLQVSGRINQESVTAMGLDPTTLFSP